MINKEPLNSETIVSLLRYLKLYLMLFMFSFSSYPLLYSRFSNRLLANNGNTTNDKPPEQTAAISDRKVHFHMCFLINQKLPEKKQGHDQPI